MILVAGVEPVNLTYIVESAKQIATPKKNVAKTKMSALSAVAYRGASSLYTPIGNVKNSSEPMRWEKILTVSLCMYVQLSRHLRYEPSAGSLQSHLASGPIEVCDG